jgi:hypothetical protein
MGMRTITNISIIFLLFISCQHKIDCVGISSDHYEGMGQIFFHKPISGSSYEFIFIPVCQRDFKGAFVIDSANLSTGVSFVVTTDMSITKEVVRGARRFTIDGYSNLAEQFREVYICPVYLNIEGITNDTKATTNQHNVNVRKEMIIGNQKISITYFYTNFPKIKAFKVLS